MQTPHCWKAHVSAQINIRGSRKFCQKCPNLITFFLVVDEGIEDTNITINGPSSARTEKRHLLYMAFHWRADNGPQLNADLVAM